MTKKFDTILKLCTETTSNEFLIMLKDVEEDWT